MSTAHRQSRLDLGIAHDARARAALTTLVDTAELAAAEAAVETLLARGYQWAPLGAKEGNFGLVNIGSDPALAFVERITNAIDAVLELHAEAAAPDLVRSFETPREAAASLLAIPNGRLANLDAAAAASLAQAIVVTVRDGRSLERPVLEVRDRGTGLAPATMPETILNLAGSNKLAKPYLAGAYGQGGSTTFAFSPRGTTIVGSTGNGEAGITFVRFRELDPRRNKNGRYDYLVDPRGAIPMLPDFDAFGRGTLVRHFAYDLPDAHAHVCDPVRGLGAILERTLFDPILPFTIVEARRRRVGEGDDRRVILGRASALDRATDAVEYRHAVDVVLRAHRRADFCHVRYWVLADDESPLHPDRKRPVAITSFGQTHGSEERRFITEALKLPYLKNALVVQIELEALSATVKRDLVSSTRDRLKHVATYRVLLDAVRDALVDDATLLALNADRRRALLERDVAADQHRLRRRFVELMEKFRPGPEPATRASENGRAAAAGAGTAGDTDGVQTALPTLEHPSFVRIANAQPLEFAAGRTSRVMIESDAPDGYVATHAEARLVLTIEPPEMAEFVRATDFTGGRARASARATDAVGTEGNVTIRFTDAFGNVLADRAPFRIVAPPEPLDAETDGRAGTRVPDIYQVFRDGWTAHGFDETSVATVDETRDEVTIFVNMDNVHLQRLIVSSDYQETGLTRMRTSYLVQVAFYAFLLHEAQSSFGTIDANALETYQRREYDRVARTVVSAIASVERIDSVATLDLEI